MPTGAWAIWAFTHMLYLVGNYMIISNAMVIQVKSVLNFDICLTSLAVCLVYKH